MDGIIYPVHIEKVWFYELPSDFEFNGTTVMVDANAASSNMPLFLSKNPARLLVVNEQNLSRALMQYPDALLAGESLSMDPERFSASNHISSINKIEAGGKDILWMSINGSRVFEKMCGHTDRLVLAGAFNNFGALVNFLAQSQKDVLIVMAGDRGQEGLEDKICGEMIEKKLSGLPVDWEDSRQALTKELMKYASDQSEIKDDLPLLLDLNRYNIVPKCFKNKDGFLEVKDILETQ